MYFLDVRKLYFSLIFWSIVIFMWIVQIVDIAETLLLFMGLQTLGDEKLMKLAYRHVVRSIERTNMIESETQKLQSVMFKMLQVCQLLNFSIIWYILRCIIGLA